MLVFKRKGDKVLVKSNLFVMRKRCKKFCADINVIIRGSLLWIKRLVDKDIPDRNDVLYIKTDDIKYFFYYDFLGRNSSVQGDVVGGNWDLNVRERKDVLTNTDKYNGIRQHFSEGVPWQDTILFRREYAKRLCSQGTIKGVSTLSELAELYEKKYDMLFEQLKQKGFLSVDDDERIGPVYIYLNRYGEIIYTSNGNHRLAMALLLGIEEIPVLVWWRHKKWQDTRKKYGKLKISERKEQYPELLSHPDLLKL